MEDGGMEGQKKPGSSVILLSCLAIPEDALFPDFLLVNHKYHYRFKLCWVFSYLKLKAFLTNKT